jgi:uncharacterized protein with WD repeat
MVTVNDTWVHNFEPETKGSPCNATILNIPGRKNSQILLQGRGHSQSLLGL